MTTWIAHILHRNWLLKCVLQGKLEETKDEEDVNSYWVTLKQREVL